MSGARPEFWACVSPDYKASLGLISRLREMAAVMQALVAAVAFPEDAAREELFQAGAAKAYCIQALQDDEGLARQIVTLCREHKPHIVLFPATIRMRCIAALAAASLQCGLCADCTAVSLRADGTLIQTRPTFADSLVADIVSQTVRPQMATVRPGIYLPAFTSSSRGELIPQRPFERTNDKIVTLLEETGLDQNPLIDARIVVSGGKGVGAAGFSRLRQLAGLLGASMGASRGAVNAGYAPYLYQVGLTGVTVRPNVYLAFGISGAVQHIVGMSNAKYVVAVNPDKDAAIFEYADLAIVASWEDVADAMLLRFEQRNSDKS